MKIKVDEGPKTFCVIKMVCKVRIVSKCVNIELYERLVVPTVMCRVETFFDLRIR